MSSFLLPPKRGQESMVGCARPERGGEFQALWRVDTGGVFDSRAPDRARGVCRTPHPRQRGRVLVRAGGGDRGQVGDEVIQATPGCYVLKPRGIPHTFWNPGPNTARILEIISPASFENNFSEMAELPASGGPPDPEAVEKLSERYGLTYHMEWIPELIAKYNLNWQR
jgi:hypothetical protein